MHKQLMETRNSADAEREPIARFRCDMARHSMKSKLPNGREPISESGMRAAVASRTGTIQEHIGSLFGSPLERTGQSSALRMFADQFKDVDFSGVDPEDIVRWLEEGGINKIETPFLNFQEGDGEYNREYNSSIDAKQYLKWIVEQSDAVALAHRQDPEKVTPFSIQAGNVASFILGEVWDQYDRLWKGETKKKGTDFVTSHQAILESFLYRVIERKEGEAAAAAFVTSLHNMGFTENQGFILDVAVYDKNNTDDWTATVTFDGKQYVLAPHEIIAIIAKGQNLYAQLKEHMSKE